MHSSFNPYFWNLKPMNMKSCMAQTSLGKTDFYRAGFHITFEKQELTYEKNSSFHFWRR